MFSKISLLIAVSLLSSNVYAEMSDLQKQRPVTRIDFNQLIEEGNEKKQDLVQQRPTQYSANADAVKQTTNDVTEFIDLEVSAGKKPSVVGVDRRYNSVSEARVVDIDSLSVVLIKKKSGS